MWLGEQITPEVGNGISLIIFSGIVAEIPRVASTLNWVEQAPCQL